MNEVPSWSRGFRRLFVLVHMLSWYDQSVSGSFLSLTHVSSLPCVICAPDIPSSRHIFLSLNAEQHWSLNRYFISGVLRRWPMLLLSYPSPRSYQQALSWSAVILPLPVLIVLSPEKHAVYPPYIDSSTSWEYFRGYQSLLLHRIPFFPLRQWDGLPQYWTASQPWTAYRGVLLVLESITPPGLVVNTTKPFGASIILGENQVACGDSETISCRRFEDTLRKWVHVLQHSFQW